MKECQILLYQLKTNLKYEKYYEINDTVNKYFKNNLVSSEGKEALKYLNDRGIDKDEAHIHHGRLLSH